MHKNVKLHLINRKFLCKKNDTKMTHFDLIKELNTVRYIGCEIPVRREADV